jgi:phenylalanyl-tRNA synthetase alpha chain
MPDSPAALDLALHEALAAARQEFAAAADLDELARAHVAHLGNRSAVALARRGIAGLPGPARAGAGRLVNQTRAEMEAAHAARLAQLERERDSRVLGAERVDVTLPWDRLPPGARHPVALIEERIDEIFVAMGYEVAEGPEVEAEWFNFDALNFPPDHPAREAQDTLFVGPPGSGLLLRTHTSPVQVRTLLERTPPIYVICPGITYRNDPLDATHTPVFTQVEGLVVDEGITMADLKGTLDHFARELFGAGLATRLRPSFFPFTEPSGEVDLTCPGCRGHAGGPGEPVCRVCGNEGWVEWGGCGMVHPNLLRATGHDPERYTGFAFGMGLERAVMFRHALSDLRDLVEGDVRVSLALGRQL